MNNMIFEKIKIFATHHAKANVFFGFVILTFVIITSDLKS